MNRLTMDILRIQHTHAGMRVVEDDHNVYLMRERKPDLLATFTSNTTAEHIRAEADKCLQEEIMEQKSG